MKRAQYGDIGRIVCGEATYFCGPTWGDQAKWLAEKPGDADMRLRAWGSKPFSEKGPCHAF